MKNTPTLCRPLAVLRRSCGIALLSALPASLVAAPITALDLFALDTLGGTIGSATAVNEAGEVVGYATNAAGQQHAFKFTGGVVTDLGTLGTGSTSAGYGINAGGTVVGYSTILPSPSTVQHAFEFSGSLLTDTNPSGASSSQAFGINDAGQAVGTRALSGATRAFIELNGVYTTLGTLGGTVSRGRGINSLGYVTGESSLAGSSPVHAFLYNGSTMADLGTLGGTTSTGRSVNDLGQVSGSAATAGGLNHAFLYTGGSMADLGTLGGTTSNGYGVNNLGQVVGISTTAANAQRAFLYNDGTMNNLQDVFSSFLSNGTTVGFTELTIAEDISDSGWIVGTGRYFNGTSTQGRAFVARIATPSNAVPDSGPGLALLGVAFLGLLAGHRRCRTA